MPRWRTAGGESSRRAGCAVKESHTEHALGARADPSLPAILCVGPALLLDLQPPPRRPRLVQARFFLRDQALIVVRNNLCPRLETVLREPTHWQHQVVARHDDLKAGAPITQRPAG